MGCDKAQLVFPGDEAMAVHVGRVLLALCSSVVLVRHRPDEVQWPFEVIVDAENSTRHPLFGVAAALKHACTPMVFIATCDVPWLTADAVRTLIVEATADGAVAFDGKQVHPLVAVLPSRRADEVLEAAVKGLAALTIVAPCARVRLAPQLLGNVNEPADLG
jgi:molybdenum cofactor guanylyltransferase